MAKRFINKCPFDDTWFMNLSKDAKLMWIYSITKCDHAGIIEINPKLCNCQTEIGNVDSTVFEIGERFVPIEGHTYLYFIPKFIHFQYCDCLTSKHIGPFQS